MLGAASPDFCPRRGELLPLCLLRASESFSCSPLPHNLICASGANVLLLMLLLLLLLNIFFFASCHSKKISRSMQECGSDETYLHEISSMIFRSGWIGMDKPLVSTAVVRK